MSDAFANSHGMAEKIALQDLAFFQGQRHTFVCRGPEKAP